MNRYLIMSLIVAIGISVTAVAQSSLDSLFYRDGREEGVKILKNTKEMVEFSYPNESVLNELPKTDLKLIKYGSGRIEDLYTIEDTLPLPEPGFVGEVYLVKDDNGYSLLDKETAEGKMGKNNIKMYVTGSSAELHTNIGETKFIVKSVDNESDPMSVITIFQFKSRPNKRQVLLARDNSNSMINSKTYSKFKERFTAEKYGRNSYLVLTTLKEGEYGIRVVNPNNVDEKNVIISCIGIDKINETKTRDPYHKCNGNNNRRKQNSFLHWND